MIYYTITNNCLTIPNSYNITDKDVMNRVLEIIREKEYKNKYEVLNNRTNNDIIKEWRAHNLLYKLNIFRSHTKTVDLEYPQKWYYKLIWKILG